ncbi:nucleocapsid [Alphacytorhabdovirus sambuci]|uniref:Nucleoprotein n=1 Tax=Sambucus cytorhabdovirus TaxID=2944624 RepID=A0AAE9HVK3_9RHAB|nr:nucleocapsid [Sambucus cytorhabdovirus]
MSLKDRLKAAASHNNMTTKDPEPAAPQAAAAIIKKKQGGNAGLFSKVRNMTTPGKAIPKVWSNDELSKIPIYSLRALDTTEAVLLGNQMMGMLLGNTASRDLIDILLFLAVSLRDPNNTANLLLTAPTEGFGLKTVLGKPTVTGQASEPAGEPPTESSVKAPAPGSFAARLAARSQQKDATKIVSSATAGVQPIRTAGISGDNQAAIYSFVAAFILRAHSRQPDSLIESLPRMIERCASWYDGAEIMLEHLVIDRIMVDSLKNLLARREEVMSTWVMWVAYNENEVNMNKNNMGMMSYLAGQIYQYTGLHAVVQILAIQQVTQAPMDELLGELNHRSTRQPLLALYDMLQHHELVKEKPGRKTYFRYARIWDSGYFHELQSKQCPDLVYVAAKILKEVSPTGARSDPTKIYAIQDIGDTKREFLDRVANNIAQWLVKADDDTGDSGASWSM